MKLNPPADARAEQPQEGMPRMNQDIEPPLVFARPRRRFGCGLWLFLILLLIGIGLAVSWKFMPAGEKENLSAGLARVVDGTPLDVLREHVLPKLEPETTPVPPVNESGDHGVITREPVVLPTARVRAPVEMRSADEAAPAGATAGQDLLAATRATPEAPGSPGLPDGATAAPGQATDPDQATVPGQATAPVADPIPALDEDERVRPAFIDDLAAWVVARYQPSAHGGTLAVSVQSLNQRYGTQMTGLVSPQSGGRQASRASLMRYAFTPSMVQGLYGIYADAFLRSIARTAQSRNKPLSLSQLKSLYQALGSRCTLLAGGLESVSALPDLAGRIRLIDQQEEAVARSNRELLDARFDLEQAKDRNESAAALRQYQGAVEQATRTLQTSMEVADNERRRLSEDIRRGGAGALNQETLLYLARWVDRRLADTPSALASVQASAAVLRDLAGRCARAAREGVPGVRETSTPQPAQAPQPRDGAQPAAGSQNGPVLPPSSSLKERKVTELPSPRGPVKLAPLPELPAAGQ